MSRNTEATDDVKTWTGGPLNYKEGFFTQLATDELAKGINEEVVRAISAKRNEPEWMLEFRLNAYRAWLEMEEPHWLKAHYDKLNYQDYSYYSAPSCGNCDDTCASEPGAVQQTGANAFLSKEVEAAFEQLGVPVREGKEVAVDAIFDSVSVATTYREKLAEQGIIFCSFDESDSGLDIDALKVVADGVNSLRDGKRSFIIVTHYQRILDYIKPDYVHVLYQGRIVKSGDFTLVKQLEEQGYGWLTEQQ
ncbi:TPA: hypothetical protein H6V66_000147 [Escherichia coli]|nr:hypothetical protein [Escherichia coli]